MDGACSRQGSREGLARDTRETLFVALYDFWYMGIGCEREDSRASEPTGASVYEELGAQHVMCLWPCGKVKLVAVRTVSRRAEAGSTRVVRVVADGGACSACVPAG